MDEVRKFITESLETIEKRAYENQIQGGLFKGLCQMLKVLEPIAQEYLKQDDSLLKKIDDLKKILCKNVE